MYIHAGYNLLIYIIVYIAYLYMSEMKRLYNQLIQKFLPNMV
jgi:hypothetical protein